MSPAPGWGGIRIDSGDLADEAWRARALLDALGATGTRVIVTGDLDDRSIAALAGAPVDGYGVGTRVVTGLDQPTAGFVYKLVAVGDERGDQRAVAKRSPGKVGIGGRKWAWRVRGDQVPADCEGSPGGTGPVLVDVVIPEPAPAPPAGRALQHRVVDEGDLVGRETLAAARDRCAASVAELAGTEGVVLVRGTGG